MMNLKKIKYIAMLTLKKDDESKEREDILL